MPALTSTHRLAYVGSGCKQARQEPGADQEARYEATSQGGGEGTGRKRRNPDTSVGTGSRSRRTAGQVSGRTARGKKRGADRTRTGDFLLARPPLNSWESVILPYFMRRIASFCQISLSTKRHPDGVNRYRNGHPSADNTDEDAGSSSAFLKATPLRWPSTPCPPGAGASDTWSR